MPIFFQTNIGNYPIELESIGNNWKQDSVDRPHGHPFFHWLQTEAGSGQLTIDKKTIFLNSNEGILISPFTPHRYLPLNGNWQTNFLTFRGPITPIIHQLIDHQPFILAEETPTFSFQQSINSMIQLLQLQEFNSSLSTSCYHFLLEITQQQKSTTTDSLYKKFVSPNLLYIHEHLSEELTVQQLARQSFISSQYLTRLFSKYLSMSPYQYILETRIHAAKELLINQPNLSIQFIAQAVGFESASQFSMLFKKKTTFTPKQFRQQY